MTINFFDDPNLAPKPREEIRIEDIQLSSYLDNRRLKLDLAMTPFAPSDRPCLSILATNSDGEEVASMTVIDTMQNKMSFTLHIREPEPAGEYKVVANLYYIEGEVQHTVQQTVTV